VQLVASVVDHVSVVVCPANTRVGLAVNEMTGVGRKVTVVVALPEPPGPSQVSVKLAEAVRRAVASDPLVARGPLQAPEAVQLLALAADQLSVLGLSRSTTVGAAFRLTAGAGVGGAGGVGGGAFEPPPPQATTNCAPSNAAAISRAGAVAGIIVGSLPARMRA